MTMTMTEKDYLSSLEQANTYVAEGQYAEAIAMLEPLVNSDISAIQGVISFCLGDICKCIDSIEDNEYDHRAKEHLSRAVKLASAVEDNQVVVAAKAALAQVETALGNEEQAQRYRQEARDEFQAMPEIAKWEELQERLEEDSSSEIQYLLFLSACGECKPDNASCPPNRPLCGRFSGSQDVCVRCGR